MKCPKCSSTHSRVVDSRHADEVNAIRRRRECEQCAQGLLRLNILKKTVNRCQKDGTREQFLPENTQWFGALMKKTCALSTEDITNNVEWKLRDEGRRNFFKRNREHVMNLLMHVIKFLM